MIALYRPGSPGGLMECPACGKNSVDDWKRLAVQCGFHPSMRTTYQIESPGEALELDWMRCAADDCGQIVVRVHEGRLMFGESERGSTRDFVETDSWNVHPRFRKRRIDPLVPEPFRSDYLEAAAILDMSPRMSAVLSRKIVHDLIERYARIKKFSLASAIDKFNEDAARPPAIRDNLHYLREIADFGAHTQRDKSAEDETDEDSREDDALILDVSHADAEWCLNLLDRLFEHLIVTPERDANLKQGWDEKIKKAKRKGLS